MVKIIGVQATSAAAKNNIRPGDALLAINNHEIRDVLDYKFYLCDSKITLKLKRDDNTFEVVITKPQYADIGLEFENYMMDEKKSCANDCIFCFIDQLPQNCLRESLYFKDDDERLSFLHGNYITLTNLEAEHVDRIIKFKISPVNISVHTTNPTLRVKMMRNKRAGEVLKYIERFDKAGIDINAQIVLCKNINDGAELERTLKDLCKFQSMWSIAVVPAGLTKFRAENNLYKLENFDKSDCEKVIDLVDSLDSEIVYCADEFYLKAERELPNEEYYGDYPQYENGVGMISSFRAEFYDYINYVEIVGADIIRPPILRNVSVITGEAAYPLIKELVGELQNRFENLTCTAYKIKNNFFGENITVVGLITGGDIISQLTEQQQNGQKLGEELIIPASMLRYERDLFLDNVSVQAVERALSVRLIVAENNAEDFIRKVLGIYD